MRKKNHVNVAWDKILVIVFLSYFCFSVLFQSFNAWIVANYGVYSLVDVVGWALLILALFAAAIYWTFKHRKFRLTISILVVILTGLFLSIFLVFQSYAMIEFIILVLFIIISALTLIISRLNVELYFKLTFLALDLIILLIMSFIFAAKPYALFEMLCFLFFILGVYSTLYSYKSVATGRITLPRGVKLSAFILFPVIMISSLYLMPRTITITPESNPDYVFWTGATGLPKEVDTLRYCAEHDIEFTVVLRTHYIEDGGEAEYIAMKRAVDNGVTLHVSIGGPESECYLTMDNAKEFKGIYDYVKAWLIDHELFSSIESFMVDAEPPRVLLEDLENMDFFSKWRYFINTTPSSEVRAEAEQTLDEFITAIHGDGKTIGIVKMPTMGDDLDGDGDYSYLTRTIYGLDVTWDFSVSMNYRTMHIPTFFDYFLTDLSSYDYITDYELTYLTLPDVERNLIPLPTFYHDVAVELYSQEFNIERENRYVFIGTFWSKFGGTSYVQGREYLKDIDICRSFGVKKVFIYDYTNFVSRLGVSELENIIAHEQEGTSWQLEMTSLTIQREIMMGSAIGMFDRMIRI